MRFLKQLILTTLLIFTFQTSSTGSQLKFLHEGNLSEYKTSIVEENSISDFDTMAQNLSEGTEWDWRLIIAIASAESSFSTTAKSHRGASGLMQIMPNTAKHLGYQDADLNDPQVSIKIALELLDTINSSFRFPQNISEKERLSVVLASYNAGIGYVIKARKAAYNAGSNHNSWASLRGFITRNNTHGETVAYVDKVISKYYHYKNI